jgi:hypothetical protein
MASSKPATKKVAAAAADAAPAKTARKPPAAKKPTARKRAATAKPAAKKPVRRATVGPVVRATRRDLAAIKKLDEDLADSALAAIALALAKEVDQAKSGQLRSMCAGQLREVLKELRSLTPAPTEGDRLDDLRERRAARRRGTAAA